MTSFVRLLFFHGIIYHALDGVHCLPEALPLEKKICLVSIGHLKES